MGNNYDVLLRFILDEASKQKTKAGVDALTGDLTDVEKITRAVTKDFETLEKQIAQATSPKEFDVLERKLKDVDSRVKEITKSYSLQARVLRAEAADMISGFEKVRVAQIKAFGSRLGGISQTGLLASGALLGGAFAEANRFAKEAEDTGRATQATREWTAATKELAAARTKVDTVLLRETLPLLQKAAEIATQVADFIEDNPAVIRAALETGKIVAGLSVLGILASKGIALYADIKAIQLASQELQAANLQDQAASKQLQAAQIQAGVSNTSTPKGPGGVARAIQIAGAVTLVASSVILGASIGNSLGNAIAKLLDPKSKDLTTKETLFFGGIRPVEAAVQKFQLLEKNFLQMITLTEAGDKNIEKIFVKAGGVLQSVDQFWQKTLLGIDQAEKKAEDLLQVTTGLRGSEHEAEIVAAFEKWQAEDARIVQEAAQRRLEIVRESEGRIAQATAQFAKQVSSINASAAKRAESLTSNFLKTEAQAEAQYQEQRAQIIREGGEQIREIEEAHQERLRKMIQQNEEREADLTAARDALGLVKERRRFNQERAEEERSTRIEIAKQRADLAQRLADLDRQNQAERAQRLVAFQEALAENEAQRKEELKQAAAAHAEELKQIRDQRAQQLRELQEGLNAERLRRREVFIEQIRDLDAALLGERELRNRHYAQAIADAEAFFTAWRSKLPSATNLPAAGFASGGYASGLVRTGERGVEYIMSHRTTRAAESIIGGRLTQDALLNALARGGSSSRRSLTISDHSRFDGKISSAEVRAIKRETRNDVIRDFFGDA
jgi:hypothetical protein